MQAIYGTDNYEWNHYKLPTGQVYDFLKQKVFMKRFLDTLYIATKDNETINNFLPLSKNYAGKFEDPHESVDNPLTGEDDSKKIEQSKDCLFLNLLYTLRHPKTGECSHTTEFSCLDEEILQEFEGIKNLVQFYHINLRFCDKLNVINDILIPYGFFLKVYVLQKKLQFKKN